MHHPTKNAVTSGRKWASQLVSQSKKMAFRLFKTSLCLWTICFVSVYNEDGKIFQAHTFDFLSDWLLVCAWIFQAHTFDFLTDWLTQRWLAKYYSPPSSRRKTNSFCRFIVTNKVFLWSALVRGGSVNIHHYNPSNLFARARLVYARHVTEYSPAK